MKSNLQNKGDFIFIDGDHEATMRRNHFPRMTCLGNYKLDRPSFICRSVCVYRSKCVAVASIKRAGVEELPEYITHRDSEVRELAKQRLEELESVTNN